MVEGGVKIGRMRSNAADVVFCPIGDGAMVAIHQCVACPLDRLHDRFFRERVEAHIRDNQDKLSRGILRPRPVPMDALVGSGVHGLTGLNATLCAGHNTQPVR